MWCRPRLMPRHSDALGNIKLCSFSDSAESLAGTGSDINDFQDPPSHPLPSSIQHDFLCHVDILGCLCARWSSRNCHGSGLPPRVLYRRKHELAISIYHISIGNPLETIATVLALKIGGFSMGRPRSDWRAPIFASTLEPVRGLCPFCLFHASNSWQTWKHRF